jgi:hypothetical protein
MPLSLLRLPGEGGCNPIGMQENGGEFLPGSEIFRSHIPISDRYSGANFRKISAANQSNPAFSATVHGKANWITRSKAGTYFRDGHRPSPVWRSFFEVDWFDADQ